MTTRNLSPYAFFEQLAARHQPRFRFTGRTKPQFAAWKKQALPTVLATLGKAPQRVDPKPELLANWEEHGLIKERWVIDTQPGLSAIVLLWRPAKLKRGEKRPAILCCHGHGPYGKDPMMGIAGDSAHKALIDTHHYDYGLRMAQEGFVTYAIDWLGFGERDSRRKPYFSGHVGLPGEDRDPCNVHFLCATMLGTTVLAMNLHDARAATDFLCSRSYVNSKALGVMGLSLGGTMATWNALYDPRFKATDIIGYAGSFHEIAYRTYNVCGSQITPGLFALVDVPDLQGLIAPRPMLMELGIFDSCFEVDYTLACYRRIEQVYKAAGAMDNMGLDLFPGEHAWGGNKSVAFFRKHLGAAWA